MATVPEQTTRVQATAFGGQTVFTYPFLILKEEDILVYLTPVGQTPDPTADLLTLNVDYTVTGVGNQTGGTIVLTTPATLNDILTMERNTIIKRETDFSVGGQFTADAINLELDRLTMISQEIETQLSERGLTYQVTDQLETARGDNILPPLNANSTGKINVWSKSSSGTLINVELDENADANTLRSELASQTNGADGALLVGYFDSVGGGKTVKVKLDEINTLISDLADSSTPAASGAGLIGYNANSSATTVRDELDVLNSTRSVPINVTLNASLYEGTVSSSIFPFTSYNEDTLFKIKFNVANPGAVTLDLNGIGAKDLKDVAGDPLTPNYIGANDSALIYYHATADEFRFLSNAEGTDVEFASKTEVQNDNNLQKVVYLSNFRDHPGIARAWGVFLWDNINVVIGKTYNVTSIVESLVGPDEQFDVTLNITLDSSNYVVLAYCDADGSATGASFQIQNRTSTSFRLSPTGGSAPVNKNINFIVYGQLA